jgi:hypothetical protein
VTHATSHSVERGPVIAALIFYRQTPERLYRCVKSLEGSCDGVVALDGPFAGLEGDLYSPADNYEAIADAAEEIGVEYRAFKCEEPWRGEPEKRTAAARSAMDLEGQIALLGDRPVWGTGWVLVIDSDEWITTGIDWTNVLPYAHGTSRINAYRGDTPAPGEGGDGAKMVRLFPNTPTLQWGPAHYDVRDLSIPKTYTGWEKALTNTDEPCMTIGHDLGEKIIRDEYDAYNDKRRLAAEGKMMRVVEDYTNSDRLVVRMDAESATTGKWEPGLIVTFPGGLVGIEAETGYAEVYEVVAVEGIEAVDIRMRHVPDEDAKRKIEVRAAVEIQERQMREAQLAKRMRKRAKQWDKGRR